MCGPRSLIHISLASGCQFFCFPRGVVLSVGWELVERVERNPLWGFVPYLQQRAFLGALVGFGEGIATRVFSGGNRAGKTTVGVVDDLVQCLPRGFVPPHLLGFKRVEAARVRYVAPSLKDHVLGVAVPKFREWCPAGALVGGSFDSAFDKSRFVLRFVNGAQIQFMSYDMDLDKFGGADLDRVHFDEEPPEDIRRECKTRLWDRMGDEIFTMTPQFGLTWTEDDFAVERDGFFRVEAWTTENPHINQVAVAADMAGMTDTEVRVRIRGEYASLGGIVFEGFDEGRHVVPVLGRGRGRSGGLCVGDLDVVVGIDPGISRCAVAFCGFDRENRMVVFDELYLSGETVPSVAAAIREKLAWWGLGLEKVGFVIDPSARNRGITNAETVVGAFQREGVFCGLGQNDLTAGILEMQRRIECSPPALLVAGDSCPFWLKERARYQFAERSETDGAGVVVVRANNHLMDATRYAAMSRPWWRASESSKEFVGVDLQSGRVRDLDAERPAVSKPPLGIFS